MLIKELSFNEKNEIIDWVNNNNTTCSSINIDSIVNNNIKEYLNKIKNKIIDIEKLNKYTQLLFPVKDCIVITNQNNIETYFFDKELLDSLLADNKQLLKISFCLQKPEKGGREIYNNNLIELVEDDYTLELINEQHVFTETVIGNKLKISITFYFIVNLSDIHFFENKNNIIFENSLFVKNWKYSIPSNTVEEIEGLIANKKYKINNSSSSILENFILDISLFHLKNKKLNDIQYEIEYLILDNKFKFKVEYDKITKKSPLFSIILFLNEETYPVVMSNVDIESYKYKEINNYSNLYFLIPKNNTHITFDSSKYYSIYNYNNEDNISKNYLQINIWESKNKYLINHENLINIVENNIISYNSIYNCNLLNDILYDNNNDTTEKIIKVLKAYNGNENIIYFKNLHHTEYNYDFLLKKLGDITDDIYPFLIKEIEVKDNNIFNRRKIFTNVLSKDVCFWIINESEKIIDWNVDKENNTVYINIDQIPPVLSYILFILNFLLTTIKKNYNLDLEYLKLNVKDVIVTKYRKDSYSNRMSKDNTFITLVINLNDLKDFKDGEIVFDDNEKILLNQGDMLLYNGKQNKTIGGVSDGEKYCLIFFIELLLNF